TGVQCPAASQVGTIGFDLYKGEHPENSPERVTVPLYNMEVTSFGVAAQLGFNAAGIVTQDLDVSVRPGDLGLTITTPDISPLYKPREFSVPTGATPAPRAPAPHDAQRGQVCFSGYSPVCIGGGENADIPVKPFLSNPTSCGMFEA